MEMKLRYYAVRHGDNFFEWAVIKKQDYLYGIGG